MYAERSSLGSFIAVFGMAVLAVIVILALMGGGANIVRQGADDYEDVVVKGEIREWLGVKWPEGDNARIPEGLTITDHAKERHGDVPEEIYKMLLAGKCVSSATFCGPSDIERLHVCVDPVTGVVGAIVQFGDKIKTAFWQGRDNNYWEKNVDGQKWIICDDD